MLILHKCYYKVDYEWITWAENSSLLLHFLPQILHCHGELWLCRPLCKWNMALSRKNISQWMHWNISWSFSFCKTSGPVWGTDSDLPAGEFGQLSTADVEVQSSVTDIKEPGRFTSGFSSIASSFRGEVDGSLSSVLLWVLWGEQLLADSRVLGKIGCTGWGGIIIDWPIASLLNLAAAMYIWSAVRGKIIGGGCRALVCVLSQWSNICDGGMEIGFLHILSACGLTRWIGCLLSICDCRMLVSLSAEYGRFGARDLLDRSRGALLDLCEDMMCNSSISS